MRSSAVFAVNDFEEAGGLGIGDGPDAVNFEQLLATDERAFFLAMFDDPPRGELIEAGDVPQERHAGGIQVDADEIDATLDDGFERFLEIFRIDVMLIEADADILRLDLDEFGERVLKPAADGNRAAEGGVEFGKFLATDGAGGVDAGAGLVDDDVSQFGNLFVGRMRRGGGRRRLGTRRSGSVLLGLSLGTFGQADQRGLGRTGHAAGRRRRFRVGFGRAGHLVYFRGDRRGFRLGFGERRLGVFRRKSDRRGFRLGFGGRRFGVFRGSRLGDGGFGIRPGVILFFRTGDDLGLGGFGDRRRFDVRFGGRRMIRVGGGGFHRFRDGFFLGRTAGDRRHFDFNRG